MQSVQSVQSLYISSATGVKAMLTSNELMQRFNIEQKYTLSRRLEPLKKHLGVSSLYTQIQESNGSKWILKPEYEQTVLNFLNTGKLEPIKSNALAVSTLNDSFSSKLDILEAEIIDIEPIELNGRSENNVNMLATLAEKYQALKSENEATEQALELRQAQYLKAQKIAKALQEKIAIEQQKNLELKTEITNQDSMEKKQEKLLNLLSELL